MFAVGLCVDERYLLPSLVVLESVASTLPPSVRREVAVRVLTLDLTPQHAVTMAHLAARLGFGSFDLRWARPMREAVMADTGYISVTAYLRFQFTPAFLARPYLIYIDADTLAVDDISTPLADLPDDRLGLVIDEFGPVVGRGHGLPGLLADRPELAGRPYFNSGMWWAPTGLLPVLRTGVRAALRSGRRYIFHNDQDALNLWLLHSDAAHPVSGRFNTYELACFLERGTWTRRYTTRAPYPADVALLHFVGSAKPWLPMCPPTEHVRLYRTRLRDALRTVHRLGDLSLDSYALGRA
ncbi:glycosyltransferase family 8 protein [Nonomuraea typhae]|uniref:Glycosyltransferase family 8 protein n=1 Tax=Nonomuraea typhae TaxID=2603600 RepID=A0ABW7YL81_9ACTN